MKVLRQSVIVLLCLVCTGCASIVSKTKYPVLINTEPSAAKIEVKDQDGVVRFAGTSPATALLDSGHSYFTRARYTVTASKDGYTTSSLPLNTSMNGWYWGNIVFGGLIGLFIVDPLTGAMFEVDTPVAAMSLPPTTTAVSIEGERLRQLRELRDGGVLTEAEYKAKAKTIVREM
jgi:uncharacterized protein YceK